MRQEILRLDNVGQSVGQELNYCISFTLYRGEALCVFTEDIAAKAFLLDLFQGNLHPDFGSIYVNDLPCTIDSLDCAHAKGLYYVGENQLIPSMSVAHNLLMTDRSFYHLSLLNNRALQESTACLLKDHCLSHIHPKAIVSSLSPLDQYLLAIIHAVVGGAQIIVLDYPCYNLVQPKDIRKMQNFIGLLNKRGISVLFFSSDWKIIFQSFNRYAVIQHGVVTNVSNVTKIPPELPRHNAFYSSHAFHAPVEDTAVLKCRNYQYGQYHKSYELNFTLHKGEVLGIHDIQDQLITAWIPHCQYPNPTTYPNPVLLKKGTHGAIADAPQTIAFIYSGYKGSRIFLNMSLYDNVTLLADKPQYNFLGLRNARIRRHIAHTALQALHAEDLILKYDAKPDLSGMNYEEQCIVEIAKWICIRPEIFVFLIPQSAYQSLSEYRFKALLGSLQKSGCSILVVSCSQDLLTKLCTRLTYPFSLE